MDEVEYALKELEAQVFYELIDRMGLEQQPTNRYEQWKQDHWPTWLKRWQPVKYGWKRRKSKE